MAFCKYCGTELQEGQLCECEKAVASREVKTSEEAPKQETAVQENVAEATVAATEAAPAATASNEKGAEIVNEVKDVSLKTIGNIANLIKAPITEGSGFVQKAASKEAVVLVALQAICSAVFACVMAGAFNERISAYSYYDNMHFSLVRIFIIAVMFSLVTSVVTALCMFGFFKICKMQENWKSAVNVLAVRASVLAPAMLITSVLFVMNNSIGMVIYMTTAMLTAVIIYALLSNMASAGKNRSVHAAVIITLISAIVAMLLADKGFKMYAPEEMTKNMDALSDLFTGYYF